MSSPYQHVVEMFSDAHAGDYVADLLDWIDFADRIDDVYIVVARRAGNVSFQEVAVEIVIDNGTYDNPVDLSH